MTPLPFMTNFERAVRLAQDLAGDANLAATVGQRLQEDLTEIEEGAFALRHGYGFDLVEAAFEWGVSEIEAARAYRSSVEKICACNGS